MRRIALTLAVLALPLFAFQAPPKKDPTKPATKPAATKPAATKGSTPAKAASKPADATESSIAPVRVYQVPLTGIWGFDISPQMMQEVIRDIQNKKPDVVLWVLKSADVKDGFYKQEQANQLLGVHDRDGWKPVLPMLSAGLPGVKQVMFVEDTWGFSTLMALAFRDMYMAPKSTLDGLVRVADGWNVEDAEVKAKFRESAEAQSTAFALLGGYSDEEGTNRKMLTQAMMIKELKLSAEWNGRRLQWRLDPEGTYLIDDSPERCAAFPAFVAAELGLCKATAQEVDEVLFLEGIRDYVVIPSDDNAEIGAGEALVGKFNKRWNRNFDEASDLLDEVQVKMRNSPERIDLFKRNFLQIVEILERDPIAALKWGNVRPPRPGVQALKDQIRAWEEELKARAKSKSNGQGSSGGGRGGRGFGSPGGGPGGG